MILSGNPMQDRTMFAQFFSLESRILAPSVAALLSLMAVGADANSGVHTVHRQQAPDESMQLTDALRRDMGVSKVRLTAGTTRYTSRQAPGATLVVSIHGYSAPSFVWEGVANQLQRTGLSTLTYDLYGHGLSDRPLVDYTRALFGQRLEELLNHIKPSGKVHLVG